MRNGINHPREEAIGEITSISVSFACINLHRGAANVADCTFRFKLYKLPSTLGFWRLAELDAVPSDLASIADIRREMTSCLDIAAREVKRDRHASGRYAERSKKHLTLFFGVIGREGRVVGVRRPSLMLALALK